MAFSVGPVTRPSASGALRGYLLAVLALGGAFTRCEAFASEPSLGVQAADGFQVTLFADDDLAHDIHSMTIDSLGRVVVSGPGYVKILVDADKDGRAEAAVPYVNQLPSGAQGMYFHGRDLLCAAGEGLIRYRDRNGDDRADGPPDVFLKIKTGHEHDLHAIQKGADGWWYVIAGNAAGVNRHYAAMPTTPVENPVAGTILRLKPDLTAGEVYAHGFRNAYDFAFSNSGDLFAFDSDGERVISLPWYRPTRLFHVLPGSHQGWVSDNWIRPDEYFDMPPVATSMGRGSPTGMLCYQHTTFPKSWQGALFMLDWTFGKVYAFPLTRDGSTWQAQPIEFLTAVGQSGFAPTDAEVGPGGELYVCVGGRGTRGAVYCVRPLVKDPQSRPWPGGPAVLNTAIGKLNVCLQAPQPLSSWSRRVWEPLAEELTSEPFIKAALDQNRPTRERIRAIEILTEKFHGIDRDLAAQLSRANDPQVRARAAWSLGRTRPRTPSVEALAPYLNDTDPLVVRNAMEALVGAAPTSIEELTQPIGRQLANPDQYVRQTAARVMARTSGVTIHKMARVGFPLGWRAAIPVAAAHASISEGFAKYSLDIALNILKGRYPVDMKLEAVRILQLGLGDMTPAEGTLDPVYDGYAPRNDLSGFPNEVKQVQSDLEVLYPTGVPQLDRELERVIAMVQPERPELMSKILGQITPLSDPVDDIHRLIVCSRFPLTPTPEQRARIADAFIHLETKVIERNLPQDSSWDDRVLEVYDTFVDRDPELTVAVLENPDFGLPGHVQLIRALPDERFDDAITAFLLKIQTDPDYAWNSDVIFLLAASPAPAARDLVRSKFNDFALRNTILQTMAFDPLEEDREYFIQGLQSAPMDTLLMCIQALQLLKPSQDPHENVVIARTMRRLGDRDEERQARDQLIELLRRNLQENHGYVLGRDGDPQREAIAGWMKSVEQRFPEAFAKSVGVDEGTLAELRQRLSRVPWTSGDVHHGQQLFQSRGCVQCHGQRRALGPNLAGVAGRFSKEDLFVAIVFPNRDVSPRYQTTQIVTTDGQIRIGMVAYEAVDGLVLRDGNNQTFRIETKDIEIRRTIPQSLMPAGLLNGLSDQDLADLYAYLRSLGLTSTAASAPEEFE